MVLSARRGNKIILHKKIRRSSASDQLTKDEDKQCGHLCVMIAIQPSIPFVA
jgi:hypothetical protein